MKYYTQLAITSFGLGAWAIVALYLVWSAKDSQAPCDSPPDVVTVQRAINGAPTPTATATATPVSKNLHLYD